MMGRWSELRLVEGDQRAAKARWAEARERSGEEVWPLEGAKVGRGSFRKARELPLISSINTSPLRAAPWSRVEECHA